ncbi:MAG: hypothetical protein LBE27_06850 [Deltaproteobacteria bacterium]|nr:hypothetical protein [Deltaproteobacteria bacterium]
MRNLENKTIFQPFDFVRLIRSSVRALPGGSSVPFLMPAMDLEKRTFADAALSSLVEEINTFFTVFLSAPWLKTPKASTGIVDYALTLMGAFTRAGLVNFTSTDASGYKRITPHTSAMLFEEANAAAFLYGGIKRVLSTVPTHTPFGFLFSLLLPRWLGIPVLEVPPSPALAGLTLQKNDLILLFPQLLKRLTVTAPSEVTLLSSSSPPLDPRLFKVGRNKGFKDLIEVYGTPVTGALGHRKSGGPYELFSHFNRVEERAISRPLTGEIFRSKRIVWHKGRSFGHFSQDHDHSEKNFLPADTLK